MRDAVMLSELQDAIINGVEIDVFYTPGNKKTEAGWRRVLPLEIKESSSGENLLLVEKEGEFRTYRLDRIQDINISLLAQPIAA